MSGHPPIDEAAAHRALVRIAQGGDGIDDAVSLAAFVMLVLRDEETGVPVELQPYHYDLIAALVTHKRLVVTAHIESGKTQIGAMWLLWQLGRNPKLRMAVLCESMSLSIDIVKLCAKYIDPGEFEGSQALHAIFPNLLPGEDWRPKEGSITVKRKGAIKDASIRAFSAEGGITGRRFDVVLLDDFVTPRTTATPYLRQQQTDLFFRKVMGRAVKGGRIVFFCNAGWSDDCSAQFAAKKGVHEHIMAVTQDATPQGATQWWARWPPDRIAEFVAQNPDYMAQLFCVRRQVGEFGRFDPAAIQAALDAGRGLEIGSRCPALPPGAWICIGVDFAFTSGRKSDRSAIVVLLREPPAPGDLTGRRRVLDIVAGKWNEATGLRRLAEVIERYPEDRTRVRAESNSGQAWIIQSWARKLARTLEPYRTGASKWNPETGIPSLAAAFGNALYVLPSDAFGHPAPIVKELIDEMKRVDPSRAGLDHTGDLVMALFFAEGLARDLAGFEPQFGFAGDVIPAEPEAKRELAEALAADERKVQEEASRSALIDHGLGPLGGFLSDMDRVVWASRGVR